MAEPINLSSIFSPVLKLNAGKYQTKAGQARARTSISRLLRQIKDSTGTEKLKAALREVAENISQAL